MISTITTSTTSTITLTGSLAIIGILVLLALLVQMELASSVNSPRAKTLSRALNIGIVPLLLAFGLLVVTRIAAVLH